MKNKIIKKVTDEATLSLYLGDMHATNIKEVVKSELKYARPCVVESLNFFVRMIDEIIGKNYENVGKKIEVTMEIIEPNE